MSASAIYYEALSAYETAQHTKDVLPDVYREGLEKVVRVAKQVLDQFPHEPHYYNEAGKLFRKATAELESLGPAQVTSARATSATSSRSDKDCCCIFL